LRHRKAFEPRKIMENEVHLFLILRLLRNRSMPNEPASRRL
jgi:hypothetical protein